MTTEKDLKVLSEKKYKGMDLILMNSAISDYFMVVKDYDLKLKENGYNPKKHSKTEIQFLNSKILKAEIEIIEYQINKRLKVNLNYFKS